ncbi:hypothetical protein BG005_004431 [Podila minutissima]|nr:hypothetical protein BG005_004431 [Podila minutissima]
MATPMKLVCLVDGESSSNAFPVEMDPTKAIGDLKKLIKIEKTPRFDDVAADGLAFWHVSIPDDDDEDDQHIVLDNVSEKKEAQGNYQGHRKLLEARRLAREKSQSDGSAPSNDSESDGDGMVGPILPSSADKDSLSKQSKIREFEERAERTRKKLAGQKNTNDNKEHDNPSVHAFDHEKDVLGGCKIDHRQRDELVKQAMDL